MPAIDIRRCKMRGAYLVRSSQGAPEADITPELGNWKLLHGRVANQNAANFSYALLCASPMARSARVRCTGSRSARAASRGLPATRAVTPTLKGACVSVDNESGEAEIRFEVPRLGKAEGRQPALSGQGKEDRYESQALLL